MSDSMTGRDRSAGFQLLELMVAVVLFGLLLVVAVPGMNHHNEWNRMRGAAEEFSSRLQLARQKAVAQRVNYRLTLMPDYNNYTFERQTNDSTWVSDPAHTYTVEGVASIETDIGGSEDSTRIVLEPDGTIQESNSPAIVRFIDAESDTATVVVVRTGRVTVRLARSQS